MTGKFRTSKWIAEVQTSVSLTVITNHPHWDIILWMDKQQTDRQADKHIRLNFYRVVSQSVSQPASLSGQSSMPFNLFETIGGKETNMFVTVTKVLHSDRPSPTPSFVARVIIINIIWFYVKRFSLICYLVQIEIGINRIPINSIQKYNREKSGNGGRKGRNAKNGKSFDKWPEITETCQLWGVSAGTTASQPASHIDDNNVYNNLFFSPSLSLSFVYGKSANSQFSQGVEWVHPSPTTTIL